jgi:FAD-dependent monooxygenase
VKSILVERNFKTTRWPKMDITNVRSMELLKRMGLADELRKVG